MIQIDTVVQKLFYEIANKVKDDPEYKQIKEILNELITLKNLDKSLLNKIDKAIFISEMRLIEIVSKEAFLKGIDFVY